MAKVEALEEELVELKLKKRNFILANKDTKEIDNLIKNLEEEIMRIKSNNWYSVAMKEKLLFHSFFVLMNTTGSTCGSKKLIAMSRKK